MLAASVALEYIDVVVSCTMLKKTSSKFLSSFLNSFLLVETVYVRKNLQLKNINHVSRYRFIFLYSENSLFSIKKKSLMKKNAFITRTRKEKLSCCCRDS